MNYYNIPYILYNISNKCIVKFYLNFFRNNSTHHNGNKNKKVLNMKVQRVFIDDGNCFSELITQLLETELVKLTIQKYNSGKDIAAIEKEDIYEGNGIH